MSRVYFHAKDKEAALYGSERAYAAGVVGDLFEVATGLNSSYRAEETARLFLPLVPQGHYLRSMPGDQFVQSLKSCLSIDSFGMLEDPDIEVDGVACSLFSIKLNTALALGGDAVKLLARIHSQCELHGWVSEENAPWLAEIIEQGLEHGILRSDQGWDSVVELLKNPGSDVVMSYSVCDSFPHPRLLDAPEGLEEEVEGPDGEFTYPQEEWEEQQYGSPTLWDDCMEVLNTKFKDYHLEMSPETWQDFHYRGPTGFGLMRWLRSKVDLKARVDSRLVPSEIPNTFGPED